MKAIDKRLATLEAQQGGAGVVGVWKEPHTWNGSAGLVRVCGMDEHVSLEEFTECYPNGTLVRVLYVTNWKERA
jgi:hypothetical protein